MSIVLLFFLYSCLSLYKIENFQINPKFLKCNTSLTQLDNFCLEISILKFTNQNIYISKIKYINSDVI